MWNSGFMIFLYVTIALALLGPFFRWFFKFASSKMGVRKGKKVKSDDSDNDFEDTSEEDFSNESLNKLDSDKSADNPISFNFDNKIENNQSNLNKYVDKSAKTEKPISFNMSNSKTKKSKNNIT